MKECKKDNILVSKKNPFNKIFNFFKTTPESIEELLEVLQQATKARVLDNETLCMLEGVLNVQELRVKDAMIPKSQMMVIDSKMSFHVITKIITESGHSRFPVIGDKKNDVLGILLAKDLLGFFNEQDKFNLRDLLRPAVFIPENKKLDTLLQDFQKKRNHIAIVVDEYGVISGIITIEDVIEQIVGNIEDEHDIPDAPLIKKHNNQIYSIKALTTIEEFNTYFKVQFPNDADTIGGLILKQLGRLPKRGELVKIESFNFKVLQVDHRRIHLLQLTME